MIPKNKDPKSISDYHPISLCNVIFKLASKVIANRLKKILPSIISDSQSAFVHGRLITDNILVVFEAMHHISQKKVGKKGTMTLKLYMSKAYDRVEWICLDKTMEKLGFNQNRRSLIMRCVTRSPILSELMGRFMDQFSLLEGSVKDIFYHPTFCSL